jgi:hypothetical protein
METCTGPVAYKNEICNFAAWLAVTFLCTLLGPGANPTIVSYNATNVLLQFEKKIFSFLNAIVYSLALKL